MIDVVINMLMGLGGVMVNLFLIILIVVFMLFEGLMLNKKIYLVFDDLEMKM